MKLANLGLGLSALAFTLAACATAGAQPQDAQPLYVRDAMQDRVNPAIMAIWDVTNNAMGDDGNLDPALIDDAGWTAIAAQAGALEVAMNDMAEASELAAASPGNMTTEDYEVSMARVQELLDANPAAFRAFAMAFADHAAQLRVAAQARDIALTNELVGGADGACEGCHLSYWANSEG